jgi:cytochrome P450
MSNKNEVGDSSNNKNYLSNLIKATEEEGKWTDEEMMEEIQTMIMAGSDTTAITLSFATIMLAMHQGIQEKEKRCATSLEHLTCYLGPSKSVQM